MCRKLKENDEKMLFSPSGSDCCAPGSISISTPGPRGDTKIKTWEERNNRVASGNDLQGLGSQAIEHGQ